MNIDFSRILNLVNEIPIHVFKQCCLTKLPEQQIDEINKTIPILKSQLTIYSSIQESFLNITVLLIPNLLVIADQYLVLSNCKITKLKQCYKFDAYGIQLSSSTGHLLMFFNNKSQYLEWMPKLKCFCKLSNFSNKFNLLEQIIKDYYIIQHKKTKKYYTSYVHSIRATSPVDILHSEIQALRSIKHPSLLDLKWVYDDNHYIYLIFEYFRCEKLLDLLNQGLILDQTQLASIILQLLQSLKFLRKNNIYHGNITPNNILINTQSSFLQLFLVNMTFISRIDSEPLDQYLSNVHESYIAPEISQGIAKPSIDSDLYQIGIVLYFLTFFVHQKRKDERVDRIQMELIDKAEEHLSQLNKNTQCNNVLIKDKYQMVYCASQLDLLRRLLDKKENRIKLEEAIKHHWFINIKQKLKPKIERRKQHLPSLKTIIELCEQNEYSKHFEKQQKIIDEDSVLEENNFIQVLMQQLEQNQQTKRPSKENHEKLRMYEQFKTQIECEKTDQEKQFVFSKSMM
ncbi:unnamed protein product (macronuclear) [Paramecium tetraurelia]|uniref:Protein kinase domain-containing protein n=1 Tax=Paramecium tetraurelia TaxID=5888 RepID=A0D9Z4_PARTE|nr:uncharacterized protein GSPATT00014793001 [Paramecium tetraurelia]CAK79861.1 unnamed protein product [Paramecium tetraurelia]|eukprot:XP_001447258.1 hypothetical protein (macronuclear) [Paramecium tetraurelia strain d4-2]